LEAEAQNPKLKAQEKLEAQRLKGPQVRRGAEFIPLARGAVARFIGARTSVRFTCDSRQRSGINSALRFARISAEFLVLALWFAPGPSAHAGEAIVLNARRLHLGAAGSPEWDGFASRAPDARRLDLRFDAPANTREATLFIRQDDVRHEWAVELNGQRLGKLFLMEADLVHALPIPAGTLREGENVLSIVPPRENDDIVVGSIHLDPRPLNEAVHEGTLSVRVTEEAGGGPLPCRITIVDHHGALAPLIAATNTPATEPIPPLAIRPGVVYTGTGRAEVGLPAGDYTVFASRGFEYNVATQRVHVARGQRVGIALQLRREVATPGLVSCDTHVHTFTHSRHGDATLAERALTLAGEGIELPIATEHNLHADYSEAARGAGVADWFTPVVGNEVTTAAGHFNIFPLEAGARVPDFRVTDWPALMKGLRATPGVRVVVLNHPRNVHNNFQPFAATNYNSVTGENNRGPEFTFDAMELLNSSAQQSDYMLVFRDWFALLNHGYRVTGVGSSDSHDVSRYIVGQGRTYVFCPGEHPGRLDVAAACSNLLAGRALVSMGLLVRMTVDGKFGVGDLATRLGEEVLVNATVLGPSWAAATNVALFANGVKMREERLGPSTPSPRSSLRVGEKASLTWTLPRPKHDVHLVAIATGPGVTAPFWAIPKPYQPTSIHWEGRVIGSTNPVWLDADGDGQFTAARAYARRLMAEHGSDPAKLLPALSDFDEAVAAQAASFCGAAGRSQEAPDFALALKSAAPQVQRGFAAYALSVALGK
jgi:hypothetical protein